MGHGNQDHFGHRLSQVSAARQAAPLPAQHLPIPQEQAAIEAWLGLIAAASAKSAALALEIAECARLIKGYGDTWKRGAANYASIEARVIRPVLAGRIAVARGIDAIASARTAALLDPEGEGLARCLADIERSPGLGIAAE